MAEVELTCEGPVAIVALNRPAKRNAMTLPMQRELIAALERVAGDAALRAMIVTGADGDFCVGGDRSVVAQMAADSAFTREAAALHRRFFALLLSLDIPVIAAIEGAAFGFGAEIAAACDIVLMGETARLADPHVRFGLPPAPMILLAWPQLAGRLAAAELVMTGREVAAAQAVSLGLATRAVAPGTALSEALRIAQGIALLPADGVVMARRALRLRVEDLDRFYP